MELGALVAAYYKHGATNVACTGLAGPQDARLGASGLQVGRPVKGTGP